MKAWQVRVRTVVETWIPVEAETAEEAEREALVYADTDDLNDWSTMDTEAMEVEEDVYFSD